VRLTVAWRKFEPLVIKMSLIGPVLPGFQGGCKVKGSEEAQIQNSGRGANLPSKTLVLFSNSSF
jgi:hypothetical protein